MNDQRRQAILRWMYNESKGGKWWQPGVLTPAGNPAGNPPGNLNAAEDLSIFIDLKKKELLVSAINDRREPCFVLNECKEDEWKAEIRDAVKPWWMKSRFLKTVGKVLLWGMATFLGSYLAASAKIAVDKSALHNIGNVDAKVSAPKK